MELDQHHAKGIGARLRNEVYSTFCICLDPQSVDRCRSVECRRGRPPLGWWKFQIGSQRVPERNGVVPSSGIHVFAQIVLLEPSAETSRRLDCIATGKAHVVDNIAPLVERVGEIIEQRGAGRHFISVGQPHDTSIGVFVVDSKRHY